VAPNIRQSHKIFTDVPVYQVRGVRSAVHLIAVRLRVVDACLAEIERDFARLNVFRIAGAVFDVNQEFPRLDSRTMAPGQGKQTHE